MELILIRHGETAWNAERRLQGHLDVALNTTGLQQAQALAAALKSEKLDVIVCSDLQRAQQTAAAIAQHQGIDCAVQAIWRERNFGGFEGHLIADLEGLFPKEYAAWRALEIDNQFPANAQGEFTGESIRQFHTRIENALIALGKNHQNQKVAVVAHGGVLECAYRIAQQLPLNATREVAMLNASINRFELHFENGVMNLKLIEWGTVAHLNAALDELMP